MTDVNDAAGDAGSLSAASGKPAIEPHPAHLPPVLIPSIAPSEPQEDQPPQETGFRPAPATAARDPLPQLAAAPAIPANSPNEDAPPASTEPRKDDNNVLLLEQEVENHKANRELRREYAEKAYQLAKGGIAFWIIALSTTGVVSVVSGKQMLSDNIMIAITTGSTVNVLAAFLGVIRGLFPSPNKEEKKAEKEKEKD